MVPHRTPELTFELPFDLLDQFRTLVDFCYNPNIPLPTDLDHLFALFFVATVYRADELKQRTEELFPELTIETLMPFVQIESKAEKLMIPRHLLWKYPTFPGELSRAWQEMDRVLPFIVTNLEVLPLRELFRCLSREFVEKVAEFDPSAPKSDMHLALLDHVRQEKPLERLAWVLTMRRSRPAAAAPTPNLPDEEEEEDAVPPPPPTFTIAVPSYMAPAATQIIRKTHLRKRIGLQNLKGRGPRPTAVLDNAELFAFVLLIHGARFAAQEQICAYLNIEVPTKTAFYRAQPKVCEKLVSLARESCLRWKAEMSTGSAISFDGSWSHRRAALHCFGAFIDPLQHKVVDFDVVEQSQGQYKGDFEGTAQGMETAILTKMGARWKEDGKVRYFCHDKDNHAMAILRDVLHWNLLEKFDCNHVVKAWYRHFEKDKKFIPPSTDPTKTPRSVNALGDLEWHLLRWFRVVVKADATLEEKIAMWEGAFDHYVHPENLPPKENRFEWKDRDKETHRMQLRIFIRNTTVLIQQVQSEISTQLNESLHAIKAKMADKNYSWKGSWLARCVVAVLIMNEGHGWKLELLQELGIRPLSPRCTMVILRYKDMSMQESQRRRTTTFQKATQRRRMERKMIQKQTAATAKKNRAIVHKEAK
jgi:hypothetical protein